MCRSGSEGATSSTKTVKVVSCRHIRSEKRMSGDEIMVRVEIGGKPHDMELDTACGRTLLSEDDWKNVLKSPQLQPCNLVFEAYEGTRFYPVGMLNTDFSYNGITRRVEIPVVKGDSLFGRDFMKLFNFPWATLGTGLPSVKEVKQVGGESLQKLINDFSDVFRSPTAQDKVKHFQARVVLKEDATPRFLKARPVPYAIREKVDKELLQMEKTGVISKIDHSEWASPLVVVMKPNGKVRITGDFKSTVNSQLHVTQYPIALPEDIFHMMSEGRFFSKLDGSNAYHQLELDEKSKEFLVINTHRGLYRYNVLPQGIASSPAIFQAFMDKMLEGIERAGAYIDDCLVSEVSEATHLQTLKEVLTRMREYNFKLSRAKCELLQTSVGFLGHRISQEGIETTEEKVKSICDMPIPKNIHDIRSFLGLINFYGKFVPHMSSICEPLYRLTRDDVKWEWTKACEEAFQKVKEKLTTSQVLAHFNPNLPIGISCDASPVGLGVVLFHRMEKGEERPIAFASKVLSPTEKRYSQIEKEGLSIVFGIKRFNKYLCGRKFLLVTDHKPLLKIFGPKEKLPALVATRLHHWALFLNQYDYDVVYRKSADHGNADALSRLPSEMAQVSGGGLEKWIHQVSKVMCGNLPVTSAEVKKHTARDRDLSRVMQFMMDGWPQKLSSEEKSFQPFHTRRDELSIIGGVIMWGMRVVIPITLRNKILDELHECHLGIVKMKSLARLHVWWPNIDAEIEETCKKCESCQQKQPDPANQPLHPWQFPERPWQRLHIDLAGPFQGKMWLIVVDAHSKWPEVYPMTGTSTEAVLYKLCDAIARFGLPEQIISDNGRQFVSKEFDEFCAELGIKHMTSSAYHPRSNGEAERFIRTFK